MMTSPYERTWQRLQAGGWLVLDGGVSTELERRGVAMHPGLWSGRAAIDAWEALVDVHLAFIDAGAGVITANTYASSRLMLAPAGLGERVSDINLRAIEAALEARERAGLPEVLVAGSLSHMVPIPAGGYRVASRDRPGVEVMTEAFRELASIQTRAGVDLLILEMMSEPRSMDAMFEALNEVRLPVWCGLSAAAGDNGTLRSWHEPDVAFADITATAARRHFDVLGVMHTHADLITGALAMIRGFHAGPLMAYPDSGYLEMPNWRFEDTIASSRLASFARDWRVAGARIIGGCCGLGPAHIAAIADALEQSS